MKEKKPQVQVCFRVDTDLMHTLKNLQQIYKMPRSAIMRVALSSGISRMMTQVSTDNEPSPIEAN